MNAPLRDLPPHSVEAEQQALGAILLDQARIGSVETAGGADLFFDPVHARIFEHARDLDRQDMKVSPVSLAVWADSDEGLREIGGKKYLVRLAGGSISGNEIAHYAAIMADLYAKRRIVEAMDAARAAIRQGDVQSGIVAGQLEASLTALDGCTQSRRPVSMMAAVTKAVKQSMDATNGVAGSYVPTGIKALDRLVTGLYPGELILLGGRPSMGKTSVALNIALNAARAGTNVAICSLEMNPEAMALRALSEATAASGRGITYRDIRQGVHGTQQRVLAEAAQEVAELPIQFLSRDYADLGAMIAGAKQAKRILGDNLGLLVVDYAQLLKVQGARSRYDEVSEISRSLKALAGQLDIPILALSQLSRNLEQRDDKRPMMSDLRESGQLEQDADAVFFCYRDEYYIERDKPDTHDMDKLDRYQRALDMARNRLEIIVAKQRQGPIGTAEVLCNVALNRIWEG